MENSILEDLFHAQSTKNWLRTCLKIKSGYRIGIILAHLNWKTATLNRQISVRNTAIST